jgi:hypothetical protein
MDYDRNLSTTLHTFKIFIKHKHNHAKLDHAPQMKERQVMRLVLKEVNQGIKNLVILFNGF